MTFFLHGLQIETALETLLPNLESLAAHLLTVQDRRASQQLQFVESVMIGRKQLTISSSSVLAEFINAGQKKPFQVWKQHYPEASNTEVHSFYTTQTHMAFPHTRRAMGCYMRKTQRFFKPHCLAATTPTCEAVSRRLPVFTLSHCSLLRKGENWAWKKSQSFGPCWFIVLDEFKLCRISANKVILKRIN